MVKARIVSFVVVIAMLVTLTPGQPQAGAQDDVEIVLPLLGFATELEGWMAAVDAANELLAEKNIRIVTQQVQATDWSEYYQKIVAQMAAKQQVDIGRLNEAQMPVVIANGHVVDLTDYIASDLNLEEYFDRAFQNAGYQDGRYYGIPSGIYHMVMYYNKNMFDEAGIEHPSADWSNSITLEQVRQIASEMTHGRGPNKVFGFSAGPYMAFIGMYAVSGGGHNVFDDEGNCALTEPESIAVYKWFDAMFNGDQTAPSPTDTAVMSAFDMFRAGRIAMVVDGTWFHTAMRSIEGFDVGIAAVPSVNGEAYSSGFIDSWVIWEGTEHEAEAWEALKALASPEATLALAEYGVGGIPIRRDTLDTLSADLIGDVFTPEEQAVFIEGLDHLLAVPYNAYYNEIDNELNAIMDNWLLGNVSAEEFAAQACDIMAEIMKD